MNLQHQTSKKPHQDQFLAFINVLTEKYKPVYIYCFSRLIDSHFREGCFIKDDSEIYHRYYLLMITESATRIENEVQHYANQHFQYGSITLLVYGKEALTEAVRANNRFFITVCNEGELLYINDPFIKSLKVPCYIPTQAAVKAKKHFHHRRELAHGFLESAMECMRTDKYHLGVFMMHQVVEQCCIALIRVHLAYRSEIHNLQRLLQFCDSFSPALSAFFLKQSEEYKRLFDMMVRSYSAARYKEDFYVEQEDAEDLFHQIAAFLELAESLCNDKIKCLALEAELYKQLKTESEVSHA